MHTPSPLPFRLALAAPLLAAVLGCAGPAVAPPPELETVLAPETAPDAPDGAAHGLADAYEVDGHWWRVYGDDQLDRLVETAFAGNVDLAKSAVSVRQALYQARLAGVDLRPTLSAGLSGSARKNIKDGGPTAQSYGADLGVSYEIDLWRRLRDARDARVWAFHATLEDEASLRLATAHSVIDAYYQLAYVRDSVDAVMESLERYEGIEKLTGEKFAAGKVGSVEPTQARQSILAARARLIGLESQRKTLEQTLRNLLDLKPADLLDCAPPSLAELALAPVDLNVPLSALSNRPDLRAAEHRLRSAFKDHDATRKSWYPTVTLRGSLSSSGERAHRAFDLPFTGGSVAVNFPFLDWNRIKLNVRVSEAEYERACLDFRQAVVSALNEVDTYYFAYAKARETLAVDEEKLENDLKVADWYQSRYETGANELADWLNALNTVTDTRLAVVADRHAVLQYENLIYKAMAGRHAPAPVSFAHRPVAATTTE